MHEEAPVRCWVRSLLLSIWVSWGMVSQGTCPLADQDDQEVSRILLCPPTNAEVLNTCSHTHIFCVLGIQTQLHMFQALLPQSHLLSPAYCFKRKFLTSISVHGFSRLIYRLSWEIVTRQYDPPLQIKVTMTSPLWHTKTDLLALVAAVTVLIPLLSGQVSPCSLLTMLSQFCLAFPCWSRLVASFNTMPENSLVVDIRKPRAEICSQLSPQHYTSTKLKWFWSCRYR